MSKQYESWSNKDFACEYAASIDRMMTPKDRTYPTIGGDIITCQVMDTKLDLHESFFVAWGKCEKDKKKEKPQPLIQHKREQGAIMKLRTRVKFKWLALEYYLWFLYTKYILFWRQCSECHHPNWQHSWYKSTTAWYKSTTDSGMYCRSDKPVYCNCGENIGR